MIELTIRGDIPVKKNTQRIGRHGGIYKNPEVTAYEELLGWEARLKRLEPIEGPFAFSGTFHIRGPKDLDGVVTTILDCLQKAGLIENDKYLHELRSVKKVPIPTGDQEHVTFKVEALE